MTVSEAIQKTDISKPSSFTQEEKIAWLSEIDHIIFNEIVKTHERTSGSEPASFSTYTESDLNRELIAEAPYDALYLSWIESKIDYGHGEIGRYNNSITTFNTDFSSYRNYYNRTHMPLGKKYRFF